MILHSKRIDTVETVGTLLLGANIPIYHFGDDILSACYLINRMSSSDLENSSILPFVSKLTST